MFVTLCIHLYLEESKIIVLHMACLNDIMNFVSEMTIELHRMEGRYSSRVNNGSESRFQELSI